ncbi:YhgE/Pip domain-containing protein [Bacillus solitudinis]|uniref:YhgE/Pip domain-containing protein n=1 Tax=Bacillus solitudinis TaxID=2014074 RepID=UPI000C232051|nr:ABC transporter permease [Bacillus solitudinis]
MKAIKLFLKLPTAYVGIMTAFAFQLIFFSVWMTAYDGVSERTNQLQIALVNEDEQIGTRVSESVEQELPFKLQTFSSLDQANEAMNNRNVDMVVHIPKDFSQQMQSDATPSINYYINQANATIAKQTMEGVSKELTGKVNESLYLYKQENMMPILNERIKQAVPMEDTALQISHAMEEVIQSMSVTVVDGQLEKTNHVEGFAATMVPMMIVLSSFVGAMIMSLQLHGSAVVVAKQCSKASVFIARQLINGSVSVILALITLGFLGLFQMETQTSFFESWLFQALSFFSFLSLTQMFIILFGNGGMLFNILSLSLQLVTSGVIVPRAILSEFYQSLGSWFPATYVSDGYYTIIFGGGALGKDMLILLLMIVSTIGIAALRVAIARKAQVQAQAQVQSA